MALAQSQHKGAQRAPIHEFDSVTLLEAVEFMGHWIQPGTKGVIVHLYPDGDHFEVEFFEPKPCVATVHISQVA